MSIEERRIIDERDRRRVEERLKLEGVSSGHLYALRKEPQALQRVAPALIDLLGKIESPRVKMKLLDVASDAKISPEPLIKELKRLRTEIERDYKPSKSIARMSDEEYLAEADRMRSESTGAATLAWDLANTLVKRADVSVYQDLVDVVRDKRFGTARQMLPYALANVKSHREETIRILLEILGDEEITPHTIDALGKLKAVRAIPEIRRLLNSKDRLVKSEAKKVLKKLEKAQKGGPGAKPKAASSKPKAASSKPKAASSMPLPPPPKEWAEASTNFEDFEQVTAFLLHVASLVEGFGQSEIERIESHLLEMELDEEASFTFGVRYAGEEVLLQITIFMDDVDTPDIGFFTSPELAEAIDQLMDELDEPGE